MMNDPRIGSRRGALRRSLHVLALLSLAVTCRTARAQETVDAGRTGFDVKRPVLASACEHGCPWGELGEFLAEAMSSDGYEVVLCRNCNQDKGPRLVSKASVPPALTVVDTAVGTTTRVNAPVDFGVTESGLLAWAYEGRNNYAADGAFTNLRLIAKIEDPSYLLVAVKAGSSITDLSQIAEQHLGVKMLGGDTPHSKAVLDHYGLTADLIRSWGGSVDNALVAGVLGVTDFDVIVSELASPANNPESSYWTTLSQKFDLRFLDLPEALLDEMASSEELGMTRVTARWGLLRGVDRAIPTVARSGEAFFARDDMPEGAAYDVARAIDQHRAALEWFIRPYSYDPSTVWKNLGVPLHPGAERYYREKGYLSGSGEDAGTKGAACGPDASAGDDAGAAARAARGAGSCACVAAGSDGGVGGAPILLAAAALCAARLRRHPPGGASGHASSGRRSGKRPRRISSAPAASVTPAAVLLPSSRSLGRLATGCDVDVARRREDVSTREQSDRAPSRAAGTTR